MIRVQLPYHLRVLVGIEGQVNVKVEGTVTLGRVLDALESRYPALRGTIRDRSSGNRRALVRFFVCNEDWSHKPPEAKLPEVVITGKEPLLVIGAIAGG